MKMASPLLLLVLSCIYAVRCDRAWLTSLRDSRTLNTLAFIGTHESAAKEFSGFLVHATQDKSITEQLEVGIRVFDMRVRRYNNGFAMHQDYKYLNKMFNDVVNDVKTFLTKHPKEFVILQMQEEYKPRDTTKSSCKVLEDYYYKHWPNLFVRSWSVNDTIGQHRGKILLAQRDDSGFLDCISRVLYLPCQEQKDLWLTFFNGEAKKWDKISDLQFDVSSKTHYHQCYINYLSAMSRMRNWESVANTYQHPLFLYYNEGMNNKFLKEFKNPKTTLYIVMADFPPQTLIDLVVDSNS